MNSVMSKLWSERFIWSPRTRTKDLVKDLEASGTKICTYIQRLESCINMAWMVVTQGRRPYSKASIKKNKIKPDIRLQVPTKLLEECFLVWGDKKMNSLPIMISVDYRGKRLRSLFWRTLPYLCSMRVAVLYCGGVLLEKWLRRFKNRWNHEERGLSWKPKATS